LKQTDAGLFSDSTRRYGVPAPFFKSREKNICINN